MSRIVPVTDLTEKQRRNFSCGVKALDEYFKQFSKANHLKNIGKTFVLLDDDEVEVIGYYTISMGSIDFQSITLECQMKLPRYPIPAARLGRLAIDKKYQGKGWGEFLLVNALNRIVDAAMVIAAFAVVVDAKDEKAKSFYMHFGFIPFRDNPLTLFYL